MQMRCIYMYKHIKELTGLVVDPITEVRGVEPTLSLHSIILSREES